MKTDEKEVGGLKVTRRPREIVFKPKRKDLNKINKNLFYYRHLLYISKRNMIRLDDERISFYNFF